MLETITSPQDIRALNAQELAQLANEIRDKIKSTVSNNGGHLSSNLGMVEMTLALHRAFRTPQDKLLFDVGHQVYTHKLITNRYNIFHTLRQHGGMSGFPRYAESEYDAFEVGHASTSISAALGMARSRDLKGEDNNIVAIVGDGALTGGMCYEALNDAGTSGTKLIVVLNDNEMSISPNVGALSAYLSGIRASIGYRRVKRRLRLSSKTLPVIGPILYNTAHYVKTFFKKLFLKENFFTPLGFHYLGPIDGHNIEEMESMFIKAQNFNAPVLIHCRTKKGMGDYDAECNPVRHHGIAPLNNYNAHNTVSGGKIAAAELLERMAKDDKIVVITAAMDTGTNTKMIRDAYPDRYFDVGITEEHAVTMCAGLAKAGMKPYFFVYSTFFQRCYDQVLHDVYLQNLPVVFCLDRCGISGEDGITHHGIYDLGIGNTLPGLAIYSPASSGELQKIVAYSIASEQPMIIRYGKLICDNEQAMPFKPGKWQEIYKGDAAVVLSYGPILCEAKSAVERLKQENISLALINCSSIEPCDLAVLERLSKEKANVIIVEEHIVQNGFASKIALLKALHNYEFDLHIIALEDKNIQHGDRMLLLKDVHMDSASLYTRLKEIVECHHE